MTNPDISIQFDIPDPGECPLTFTEQIAALNALAHGEIEGEFVAYVTGATTPAVDDQDKVWHRVDASGRPIGTYVFYSGTWRKQYTHNIGEIVMYSGDPDVDFAGTGHKGTVGGEWDGFQLCSGENGSPNLSDKFVVGAKMDDLAIGYPNGDGPWKTGVSGATTQEGVGVHEIQLDNSNTYRPAIPAITAGRWEADGNTPNVAGDLYGLGSDATLSAEDAGNPAPPAIPTLPPWYALALAVFVGYD